MATLAQLESQIQKLQRRAAALRERKSAEVIASIRALMQEHGLTTSDLDKGATGKKRGRPVGSVNTVKKVVKSKLPPKYRDPVSGLTWSGHARPPAWIKDAPDRSAFLIDGASGESSRVKNAARRGRPASAASAAKKTNKRMGQAAAKPAGRKRLESATA
jgi:DNA-binding protein H-NS